MFCGLTIGLATSVTVWIFKKQTNNDKQTNNNKNNKQKKHAQKNKVKYLLLAVKLHPSS